MNTTILKSLTTASIITFGALLAGHAGADAVQEENAYSQAIETRSISVPYLSADLATEEGREALFSKISRAAKKVCGPTNSRDAGGLKFAARNRDCYKEAMELAVSQVEGGQLASLAR